MFSHCTLDLISWQILLKTCCLKRLMWDDTIRWLLSGYRRIRPYLNTDPVVELLAHYIGLYDLNRKLSCFCCFSNLFENSLNVQCIHDINQASEAPVLGFGGNKVSDIGGVSTGRWRCGHWVSDVWVLDTGSMDTGYRRHRPASSDVCF